MCLSPCGVSLSGSGAVVSLEPGVRAVDRGSDDAGAQVVLRWALPRGRGEHEAVRARVRRPSLQREQLVAKRGQQIDLPDARIRLGLADVQASGGEVDVAPPKPA